MKHWPIKALGELVDFVGGGTPRRDRPDYWGGDIPWASVKDLQSQSLETTVESITVEGLHNSASNLVPQGTVIIASRVGLGKVAINQRPVAINQDLKALTPRHGELLPHYLLLFLLMNAEYFERACVGGYLDGAVDQHGAGNKAIVDGKAGEYGNKRIAHFQTSDNRRANHSDLAKHSTWVKWAVPTAEALRQACLAQESRIAQEQPELPGVAITALSVSNSAFLGPIQVEFNPQYNGLIGGRGTGKSTILEYLRWGLCDQLPSPVADDELPNYQLRRKTLIEKTLQTVSGTVQVSFTVNGIAHVVRRNSKTDELQLKVGDADFAACREGDIRTLLPIQAYSQKQLSNVSVRLEELSRFVEAPIRAALDDLEKSFERAAAEMRQLYATLLRKRRLQRQIAKDELVLESLNEQAANIRKSLSGLSEDDTKLLAAKSSHDRAEEALETWTSDVETIGGAIK